MRRIMLFISSYIPLYILLVFKNILERCSDGGKFILSINKLQTACYFDEINDYVIVVLLLLCLISFFYLKWITKESGGIHYYEILNVEDQTGNTYFNYISVYLLSCLGLTLNSIVDVFVLLFVMMLVGYIYISNHMTYMNPMLQFLGFKVYEGELRSKSTQKIFHSILIVNNNVSIIAGETYAGSGKEDFLFIVNKEECRE